MKQYTNEQWAAHFNTKTRASFDYKPGYQGDCQERFGCSISEFEKSERIDKNRTIHSIKPYDGINEHLIKVGIQLMKKRACKGT